jgi:hypothetical protein
MEVKTKYIISKEKKLKEINEYREEEIERCNYISMGEIGGKYKIPPERLYEKIVKGELNKYCFVERRSKIFKLFYDIDIVNGKFNEEEKEKIKEIGAEIIKERVIEEIKEVLKGETGKEYGYIYSDKITIEKKRGNENKLHIYYPEIEINSEMALNIREKIIERLNKWELKGYVAVMEEPKKTM